MSESNTTPASVRTDRAPAPVRPELVEGLVQADASTGSARTEGVVLDAQSLTKHYPVSQGFMKPKALARALDGVSFMLQAGKTLAVVGESGCGKSTLARQITMIETPTSGHLHLTGVDVAHADAATKKRLRQEVQMVFQNPFGSLNPRKKIGQALEEPLVINTTLSKADREDKSRAMMARVGLRPEHHQRYPHMFSGGQRQRVAIARALMLQPKIVVADEVLVMYLGKVVESAPKRQLFIAPRHPYTRALLASTPRIDKAARQTRLVLSGELPSPLNPPSGCAFHKRCPHAVAHCSVEVPLLEDVGGGQWVACHRKHEIA
ncbi:MAG: dipeptide ABC transporter ATP-binding protein [Betaproteobacteria bacterium]|nr:MAG: dipeptide ABC transporter ATP-binding protein [Betaproteobacteria bacterium]